jgi:hypothetical protein
MLFVPARSDGLVARILVGTRDGVVGRDTQQQMSSGRERMVAFS